MLTLLLFLTFVSMVLAVDGNKTLFVYTALRHGARDALADEPGKDLFGNEVIGVSELTKVGKRQQYLLGKLIRDKYQNFLSTKYVPGELYTFSTDVNRTIESLESNLQGLYDESNGPVIKDIQKELSYPFVTELSSGLKTKVNNLGNASLKDTRNQPILHVFGNSQRFFPLSSAVCPNYANYAKENNLELGLKLQKGFFAKYKNLLNDFSIIEEQTASSIVNMHEFVDLVISDDFDDKDLSKLKSNGNLKNYDEFMKDCHQLNSDFYMNYLYGPYDNYYLANIGATPFFRDLISVCDKAIDQDSTNSPRTIPKMKIFSAHDSALVSQINVLEYVFFQSPDRIKYETDYASYLLYELIKDQATGKVYIDIMIRDTKKLLLPSMEYAVFKDKMNQKLASTSEINKYCNWSEAVNTLTSEHSYTYEITVGVLSFIFVLLAALSIYIFCRNKSRISSEEIASSHQP